MFIQYYISNGRKNFFCMSMCVSLADSEEAVSMGMAISMSS